jgi:hypothetical protein
MAQQSAISRRRFVPNPDLGDISRLRGAADRDRIPLANPRSVSGVSYASWRRERLRGRHVHPTAEAERPYRILRLRSRSIPTRKYSNIAELLSVSFGNRPKFRQTFAQCSAACNAGVCHVAPHIHARRLW